MHAFVENQGDAWTVTAAYLDRFVDEQRLLAASEHPGESEEQVPYLRYMSQIGRRVAEMHLALAGSSEFADFAPEPISRDDVQRWIDDADARAPSASSTRSAQRRDTMREADRPLVDQLLAQRDGAARPARARCCRATSTALNIRHHGDFHLGQMLIVKDDIFIIDFEGEPRRTLDERRRKAPAARDVAGLIRSIDYSATAALERALKVAPDEHGKLGAALGGMARSRDGGISRRLSRDHDRLHRLWPADPHAAERLLNFFLLEKAFYEIEYELAHRPDWLRVPLTGMHPNLVAAHRRGLMTKLSAEAYAIIEGRHSDPFHYLGLHTEGGKTVVRAFLPEASNVEAIGEHGETATLARIHDAGLFAGALPNGSKRYQLRARFGDNVVDLDDPYRFPPVLSDFDLYLLGEGTHQRLYDKLGAHPMTLDGVDGVAFVVLAPNARRVSVVGDFNFWDGRRHPMRVRGVGYWEMFVPARRAPATTTSSRSSARTGQHLPLKSDPVAFAAELRPEHRLDRASTRPDCRSRARRRPASTR